MKYGKVKPLAWQDRAYRTQHAFGYRWVPPATHGIAIARAIASGDHDWARRHFAKLKAKRPKMISWSVAEARAIIGACAAAKVWWPTCNASPAEFGL